MTIVTSPISGNLLSIGGTVFPELKTYKVTQAKLWKDAERNMNGDVRATLIGVFPKLELQFNVMGKSRAALLASKLDSAYFEVTYFDPSLNANRTAQYYAGDYSIELLSKSRGLYQPTAVNLIPVSKR